MYPVKPVMDKLVTMNDFSAVSGFVYASKRIPVPEIQFTVSNPSAVIPGVPSISQYLKVEFIPIVTVPVGPSVAVNPESISNSKTFMVP